MLLPKAYSLQAMTILCKERRRSLAPTGSAGRAVNSVSADVDRLLGPKSLQELRDLDKKISAKLRSNEPIDVEYWEQLLHSISIYKAKAELRSIYKSIIDSRLEELREEQLEEARAIKDKLAVVRNERYIDRAQQLGVAGLQISTKPPSPSINWSRELDPEPALQVSGKDRGLEILDESALWDKIVSDGSVFTT